MTGWAITINTRADDSQRIGPDDVARLLEALHDRAGSVHMEPDGSGYGATFWIGDAKDGLAAIRRGMNLFDRRRRTAELPTWPIVHVEAMTDEEQDRGGPSSSQPPTS